LENRVKTAETALTAAQAAVAKLSAQLEETETKARSTQSELDDLLLMLGDLEEKQTRYKGKIKALGGEVTDDEEEE
jgi:intracellular protein transport protein USO1